MSGLCTRARLVVGALVAGALGVPGPAHALLISTNDPLLPASADGNNLTRDTSTGLEWLDPDASAGRSYADLTGSDGSEDDFAPGGTFAGLRYATVLELSGATPQGQIDSLFKSGGVSAGTGSIANYPLVRNLLLFVGCSGSCATYGYAYGTLVDGAANPLPLHTAKLEAFPSQGAMFGESLVDPSGGPRTANQNVPVVFGNWLVRATPTPEAGPPLLLGLALAMLAVLRTRPSA